MNKTQVKEEQEKQKEALGKADEHVAQETAGSEEKQSAENNEGLPNEENEEMTKLKGEISEAKDKYLRLYSEFENFRRRTSKEKLEMIQSANEQLIISLLPVLDDFERAQKALESNAGTPEIEGLLLIQNKLRKTLEIQGVKAMEITPGVEFNIDLHEAVSQVPGDESLKGKIVDVLENGYLLNEKVIRFAKVVVGG